MYNLKEITSKKEWNDFIVKNFKFYSFLDSWEWWEIHEKDGHKVFRMGIFDSSENQIWCIMLIKTLAKRWNYFLAPHSPLIKENYFEVLSFLKKAVWELAKKEDIHFMRICPVTKNTKENLENYKKAGFIFAPMHSHAEETHCLDLTKTEDELMWNLRKTTRYIINRAKKEGVEVELDNSEESINNMIKMHHKHSNRTNWKLNYHAFSPEFIKSLFETFPKWDVNVKNAYYNWEIEATLVTITFWEVCVYYIGASDIKHPKFSPAYLLQWSAIMDAKERWCRIYNFWGVAPDKEKKHPLTWVSLFKRWFWWDDIFLTHAHDAIFSPKYAKNYIVETFRRIKRGYYYKKPNS